MTKKTVLGLLGIGLSFAVTAAASEGISNEFITISEYKGVEVAAVEGIPEITDTSVDNNIQMVLAGFSEVTDVDRPAEEGDMVTIDYTVYADGAKVESVSGTGYALTIGSGSMYTEVEEALPGKSAGDVFVVEHVFSDTYGEEEVAGKETTIEVTVKKVQEVQVPELTDEFVQTISQESDTVEEYREEMRALLEANNEEYIISELLETVWSYVVENTEVHSYPEEDLDTEIQSFYDYYQAGAEYYEMEFAEFLESYLELTEEEFAKEAETAAMENVKQDLIVALIAETEKLELTEDEYTAAKEELAEEMSYDSVEAMEEEAPAEAIEKYIMRDLVKEWVVKNCVQVEAEAQE